MGIMYLSAVLKRAGHNTQAIDVSDRDLYKQAKEYSPDFFAYSVTSGSEDMFRDINVKLKSIVPYALSIFGGPHITFFPEFIYEKEVDIICLGEGELAFAELCAAAQRKQDFYGVKNLWFKKGTEIIKNQCRALTPLNELTPPDRELFKNTSPSILNFVEYAMASRGCPYNCSYCFNKKYKEIYNQKKFFHNVASVDLVIDDLKNILKYNKDIQVIDFEDDVFPYDKKWLTEFSDRYKKEINLPFSINLNPFLVKEENIILLKKIGLDTVKIAVESGNEIVRNTIFNRNMSESKIIEACKIITGNGIFLITQNILGNPVENSLQDVIETIDLNCRIKPGYAWASLLNPYYGTDVWNYCREHRYISDDIKFPKTYHLGSPLILNNKKDIIKLYELFSIIVRYPFLKKYIFVLRKMPFTKLYAISRKLFKAYVYFRYRYKLKIRIEDVFRMGFNYMFQKGG